MAERISANDTPHHLRPLLRLARRILRLLVSTTSHKAIPASESPSEPARGKRPLAPKENLHVKRKHKSRNYREVEAKITTAEPDLLNWSDTQHQMIARLQRYRTSSANILAKHRKAIEDYRKNGAAESAREQKMRRSGPKIITRDPRSRHFVSQRPMK